MFVKALLMEIILPSASVMMMDSSVFSKTLAAWASCWFFSIYSVMSSFKAM
ncbi:hypothetical protein [Sulfurimonas sp. NW9]|uniref:hypothetical protein n=1 Tax=Sulfurimonas sp. NW9 TaxID=2922728 RepID=UPI003DA933C6